LDFEPFYWTVGLGEFFFKKKTKAKNWLNRKQQKEFTEIAFRYKKGKVFLWKVEDFF